MKIVSQKIKNEWTKELEDLIKKSTTWGYDGEDEYEVIDPFEAATTVISWLEEKKLIKVKRVKL